MSTSSLGTKGLSLSHGSVGTLREWKGLYQAENANYDSAALYAEVRLAYSCGDETRIAMRMNHQ
jgi:hypothetical protein